MGPHFRVFPSHDRTGSWPRRRSPRCAFRVTLARRQRQELERPRHTAQPLGKLHDVTCRLARLAVTDGQSCDDVARPLRVTPKTGPQGLRRLLVEGLPGRRWKKSPGRPPQLTNTQQHTLAALIEAGPVPAGCAAACGRAPMIQHVSHERWGVFDTGGSSAP